jgi:hypothetical protein
MAQESKAFKHSTPALYERYMGPLLFEPFARLVAERATLLQPTRILETAAGIRHRHARAKSGGTAGADRRD